MIYDLVVILPIAAFMLGLLGGYVVGRHEAKILDKIRTLEAFKHDEPEPVKPAILMGAYQSPTPLDTTSNAKTGVGVAETKTPQLLEWENSNKIEAEALGKEA